MAGTRSFAPQSPKARQERVLMARRRERFAKGLKDAEGEFAGVLSFAFVPQESYTSSELESVINLYEAPKIIRRGIRERRLTPFCRPNSNVYRFQRSQVADLLFAEVWRGRMREVAVALLGTGIDTIAMPAQWLLEMLREAAVHGWRQRVEELWIDYGLNAEGSAGHTSWERTKRIGGERNPCFPVPEAVK
jgi:hypothetical protein